MPAPTYVAAAENYVTPGGSVSITKPGSVQSGDIGFLVASGDSPTDPGFATPSGWTYLGKTAAANMYSYVWYRIMDGTETTISLTANSATLVGAWWRNATLGTVGPFGVRSGTNSSITAPAITTAEKRLFIFADRTVDATGSELDHISALTYGTVRFESVGNPTVNSGSGIVTVYFADGQGSGDNTATMSDSSGNAWGLQIELLSTSEAVSKAASTSWNVASTVSASRSTLWNVRSLIQSARSTSWNVRALATATRSTSWRVVGRISKAGSTAWNVARQVSTSRSTSWHVAATVGQSRSTLWGARAQVAATRSTTWHVDGALVTVSRAIGVTWHVASTVHADRSTTWHVRATTTTARSTTWDIHALVGQTRHTAWHIRASTARILATAWTVRALVSAARATRWHVQSPAPDTTAWSEWDGTTETPLTLAGQWDGTTIQHLTKE